MGSKPKKNLRVKIVLILFILTSVPAALSFFLPSNPIIFVGVGIFLFAFSSFLIFSLLKPLGNLVESTQVLSGGNLNHRIDIRTNDEFETLGQSFNLMAEKLQKSLTNMEQDKDLVSSESSRLSMILSAVIDGIIAVDFAKNIVLVNKAAEEITGFTMNELEGKPISQFIHFFGELGEIDPKTYCQAQTLARSVKLIGKDGKQATINLLASPIPEGIQTNLSCILILHDLTHETEIERMKLDFVSMASHELRTPLTSIIGYLSVFLGENKDKMTKDQFELLNHSLVSAQQLLTLVQNLLNVNKIEKDQLAVSAQPLDYWDILSKAVEDLQNQAKLKNITLTVVPPESPLPKVLADTLPLTEVITNLVSNAISYTPSGGKINVFTKNSPTEVITTVSDTGVGIPKEAILHLFTKFFRVSNYLQKGSKGTGLGLYISKSIITKLNGKIWVESEIGKGSQFHFSLPVVPISNLARLENQQFVSEAIQKGALNY